MFIARIEELSKLSGAMRQTGHASLVYGKRRVGKTRLIKEALKQQEQSVIYYECIKGTMQENINAFVKLLSELQVLTFASSFQSFTDVFAFLNSLPRSFVIVIDEYPYLSSLADPETVDSVFQTVIDQRLSNIHLVISGSQISVMKDLLKKGNALYGRFQLILYLHELNYRDAALFYPSKTPYEKIAFYSVFGGSPFVLQELREEETLEENISRTILDESSSVFLYVSNLLLTDYSNAVNAERILSVLGNGKKKYSELEKALQANSTGNLAKQLKSLQATELVKQLYPINKPDDSKKKFYEINDNLVRFWYTYLYHNRSALQMIGAKEFFDQYISPTLLSEYVPHRFEDLCRNFFSHLAKSGQLPGITNIGTYYFDDPLRHRNGEFDVALAFGDQVQLFEAKYYKRPLALSEIHKEAGQIREIEVLKVVHLGFIAVNGFEKQEDGYSYYNGEDLYR
ncbi:MAG: AAA family ATPase [Clostridia bacterium]|nr:AAA family ATPase [Clostridia bacterium]